MAYPYAMKRGRLVWLLAAVTMVACAEKPQLRQVQVIGAEEEATATGRTSTTSAHVHYDSTILLPSDQQVVEPAHPYVATLAERALVHIHPTNAPCSGVVISPTLVMTAHQCAAPDARGITRANPPYRVEVSSGALAWTTRTAAYVVTADCSWDKLDIAILVLTEPVDWIDPPKLSTAPGPGARVQALGFGRCSGQGAGVDEKIGAVVSVDSQAMVLDMGLCRGDVGGPVVERGAGGLIGIVSHQDDPDEAVRHTTTIYRADTTSARKVVKLAKAVADGGDISKLPPIACE
jgi:hypothetical protein